MDSLAQDVELRQAFLIEAGELLQGVERDLLQLESAPTDAELVNRVFRAMHSVKGTAGFLGLAPIVKVSHRAEDVLVGLRQQKLQLTRQTMNALLAACDQLTHMLEDLAAGDLKDYSLDSLVAELEYVQTLNSANVSACQSQNPPVPRINSESLPDSSGDLAATDNPKTPVTETATPAFAASTMRVDVRKLDELVNLIGELVLERNRLLQLARDLAQNANQGSAGSPLMDCAARMSFITEELQAAGLRTRMVPVETLFYKFPRMVRDMAQALGKEVELIVRGQETEMDKTMVELISEPLIHLLRNSLDHGIESPERRAAAGKPRRGVISLEARHEGDHVLIVIADDGVGIDRSRVVRKAIEKRLINEEQAARLSTKETLDLIFLPGFSTLEQATNLSGRGVGMDVVRSNLKKMNGTIEVDSRSGRGTTISLRLPLTLAILPVLLVRVADEVYAIPLRSIQETAGLNVAELHRVEDRDVVCLRSEVLPLVRLRTIFSAHGSGDTEASQKLVVLSAGEASVALLVDGLLGQESTVVRPLAPYLNRCPGIAGTTLDADGQVRLVIDPAGLLATGASPEEAAL